MNFHTWAGVFGAPTFLAIFTHSLTHLMWAETNWEPWYLITVVSPMKERGGTWDFPIINESGKKKWSRRRTCSRACHCALSPCRGRSAHHLLEVHSNKKFLFAFRAAIGNTMSCAIDCCGYCQESWQRKHTNIKYCNAELADYTKVAKFSCTVSPFICLFPACYHNYAIESLEHSSKHNKTAYILYPNGIVHEVPTVSHFLWITSGENRVR